MVKKIIFLSMLFVIVVPVSFSQEQENNTPQLQTMIQQQMDAMIPMINQVVKVMMDAKLEVLSQPESAEKLATFTRNYYNELIKKGFDKEEALKIVLAVGIPTIPSMQKQ